MPSTSCKHSSGVPSALRDDLDMDDPRLRTYDIDIAFEVVDSRAPGLRGRLRTFGYCVPDPEHPHRLTVWFVGGDGEAAPDEEPPAARATVAAIFAGAKP